MTVLSDGCPAGHSEHPGLIPRIRALPGEVEGLTLKAVSGCQPLDPSSASFPEATVGSVTGSHQFPVACSAQENVLATRLVARTCGFQRRIRPDWRSRPAE